MPSENSSRRRPAWRLVLTGNVLFLGLVSLLTDLASEMIYPLLPLFLAGLVPLGMAPVYVGVMEGVAETTASVVKLLSGRISDASGRRRPLVLAGYALSSFGRPLMALATAGWHVIALRFLDRVGKGIRTSPRDALITDSVPSSVLGRAFSFHRMMDHTGAVLGPQIAFALGAGIAGLAAILLGAWRLTTPTQLSSIQVPTDG
ncbi:MAG: MFS transporter [bacterium]